MAAVERVCVGGAHLRPLAGRWPRRCVPGVPVVQGHRCMYALSQGRDRVQWVRGRVPRLCAVRRLLYNR